MVYVLNFKGFSKWNWLIRDRICSICDMDMLQNVGDVHLKFQVLLVEVDQRQKYHVFVTSTYSYTMEEVRTSLVGGD